MKLLRTLEEKVAPDHAVLVTVDVQNDFCHERGFLGSLGAPMGLVQAMVPRLCRLLETARARGVPVIHVISHHDEEYASPVVTEQKPQLRVQTSPRIRKVAVRFSQHSPMFGQSASSQIVFRRCSRMRVRSSL